MMNGRLLSSVKGAPHAKADSLYGRDFVAWTREAVDALESGRLTPDLTTQIATEILDMGKRDYREARSRLKVLLMHVLKCLYQTPKRSRSWYGTISTQRSDLNVLLQQSPSIRRYLEEQSLEIWEDARYDASAETGLTVETFPQHPVIDLETALSHHYMPNA